MKRRPHKRYRSIRQRSVLRKILLCLIQGPGDEQRTADDVLARDETPEAAIKTVIAIVSHSEVAILGYNQVAALKILAQGRRPLGKPGVIHRRPGVREVVASRVIIALADGHEGLSLTHAVQIQHTVFQMNLVSGHGNDSFDQINSWLARGGKYRNVAAMDFPIRHEKAGKPLLTRGRQPVDKYVVPNEQGVHHGTGRNLKLLNDESKNKQPAYKYRREPGNRFR